jgi:hypothetical protein
MKKQVLIIALGLSLVISGVVCFEQSATAESKPIKLVSNASGQDKKEEIKRHEVSSSLFTKHTGNNDSNIMRNPGSN